MPTTFSLAKWLCRSPKAGKDRSAPIYTKHGYIAEGKPFDEKTIPDIKMTERWMTRACARNRLPIQPGRSDAAMWSRPLSLTVLCSFACLTAGTPAQAQQIDLSSTRIVDLTHPFDKHTIYWPTSPFGFELKPLHKGPTPLGFYYAAYSFCAPEHGGTHLDAPAHFAEGVWSSGEIPVERFIGPAVVIDVGDKAKENRDYTLTPDDIAAFEAKHGTIQEGAIVLLRTGWGSRYPDRLSYLGDDRPGDASNLHFPSFGVGAVKLLIGRRVGMIGVDTASIDPGNSKDFPVHRLAAATDVAGLENLAKLEELPPRGATLIALPMKIAGGSGAPLRVIALVPKRTGRETK
jgi:kynurenine formamidase